jgi:molybdopterin synthase sulfur carrier subunit
MQVRVRIFGDLAKSLGKEMIVDLPSGSTVEDLIDELGEKSKKLSERMSRDDEPKTDFIVLIGGLNVQFIQRLKTILKEGDVVSLLPPAGGG